MDGKEIKQKSSKKYHCEYCDYITSHKNDYTKHCDSIKHRTITLEKKSSKSNPKIPEKLYCEICDYTASQNSNMTKHLSTGKHQKRETGLHSAKVIPEKSDALICEICDYKTTRKYNMEIHELSIRHKNSQKRLHLAKSNPESNPNESNIVLCQETSNTFMCEYCSKTYMSVSGLWKHKNQCKKEFSDIPPPVTASGIDKDFVLALFQSNQDFQKSIFNMFKENSTIIPINNNHSTNNDHSTNTNTNTNTINSHNKTFNLQMYLNETCKNAMNLSEFVDTIVPTLEELENTARNGYVKGVSSIFTTRLDKVNNNNKPIHCTDGKREIFYIKENNIWNKEAEEKTLLLKAIKSVAHKNICNIQEWQKNYPDCNKYDSRKNDLYLKIVSNSMSGGSEEESQQNYEKIITNVAKKTIIDKLVTY